jgi:hypothetical protein
MTTAFSAAAFQLLLYCCRLSPELADPGNVDDGYIVSGHLIIAGGCYTVSGV